MKEIGHITLSIVLGVLIVSNNNCRGDRLKHTVDAETIMKRLTEGSNGMTPTVKDFDLEWVRTLTQRGEPTVYTKQNSSNFEYIGMPIGGIATGQLYLGGDGKLWYWDIFNNKGREHVRGVETYRNPYKRSNVGNSAYNNIQQGFAIRMSSGGQTQVRTLGFDMPDSSATGKAGLTGVTVKVAGKKLNARYSTKGRRVMINLERSVEIKAGQSIEIKMTF